MEIEALGSQPLLLLLSWRLGNIPWREDKESLGIEVGGGDIVHWFYWDFAEVEYLRI